jgi:hypothetical protein
METFQLLGDSIVFMLVYTDKLDTILHDTATRNGNVRGVEKKDDDAHSDNILRPLTGTRIQHNVIKTSSKMSHSSRVEPSAGDM